MKMTRKILIAILLCLPMAALVETVTIITPALAEEETATSGEDPFVQDIDDDEEDDPFVQDIDDDKSSADNNNKDNKDATDNTGNADNDGQNDSQNADNNTATDPNAQKKLDEAKEKEQSVENRMLGGLTTLATGIGGMQLAQGLAEKSADSAADKDMDAYIATMRCTYTKNGKSFKFGDQVELPGNNVELMGYRDDYIKLALDLKERKNALDMKPGIESEIDADTIESAYAALDRNTNGLYDNENTGVVSGTYASRYRAAAGSEKDKAGLASDKKEAKTRMIAGGVVAGVGVVGGILGNSIINGKLGELIKKNKDKKATDADNKKAISKLKSKARSAGLTDPNYIDTMGLESYNVGNYIEIIDKAVLRNDIKGDTVEHLCPTPQIECADKLLTPESKKEIMGEVAMGSTGVNGVLSGAISNKAKDALKNTVSNQTSNQEQPAEEAPAAETPAEEAPAEQPAAEQAAPAEEKPAE